MNSIFAPVRTITAGLVLVFVVTFAACSGGEDSQKLGPQTPAPTSAGLPALPDDRDASQLVEALVQGQATLLRSAGATDLGTGLLLDASSGPQMEWGMYGFNPADGASLDSLRVLLDSGPENEAWIGLANYSTGKWEFKGPYSSASTLLITGGDNLSPGGNLYCCVVVAKGESATVSALSVRTINPQNEAPVAAFTPSVTAGEAPLTVNFDASASADSDGTIIEYAWDWDGDGGYDALGDGPLLQHVFSEPGIYSAKLRVSDEYFARDTEEVEINVTAVGNNPPLAVLGGGMTGDAPLTVLLDASLSSAGEPSDSIVLYQWDFNSDSVFDAQSTVPSVQHTYTQYGLTKARVRVTDTAGNQDDSNQVNINVNAPPVAKLELAPDSVQKGEPVDLFGGQSTDADNGIVKYEWDTDGNGALDLDSGFNNTVTVSFDEPGVYSLSLRVTDGAGATNTTSATLAVHGWSEPQTLDNTADTGRWTSQAIVSGRPAVAYYDTDNRNLRYIRALDKHGDTWAAPLTVNPVDSDDVGEYACMRIVAGRPAISYYDGGNTDILYTRAADADGVAWGLPVIVDSAGDTGQWGSMAIVDGLPAVAYHRQEDLQLRFCKALDAVGDSWDLPIILDDSGDVGSCCSMATINGNPAVSYWDDGASAVVYKRAATSGGTSWPGTSTFVNNLGFCASGTVLLQVNGRAAICQSDNTNGDQWLSLSQDTNGAMWNSAQEMPNSNGNGSLPSMCIIDGNPAVAFYESTSKGLAYARALDKNGSSWPTPEILDNTAIVGQYSSIQPVDGGVGVSYYDVSNSSLKYIWGY